MKNLSNKNKLKKYRVTFRNKNKKETTELTDEEFLNFIRTAVINNRDVTEFTVEEINKGFSGNCFVVESKSENYL